MNVEHAVPMFLNKSLGTSGEVLPCFFFLKEITWKLLRYHTPFLNAKSKRFEYNLKTIQLMKWELPN